MVLLWQPVEPGVDDGFVDGELLAGLPDILGVFGPTLGEQPLVPLGDGVRRVPLVGDRHHSELGGEPVECPLVFDVRAEILLGGIHVEIHVDDLHIEGLLGDFPVGVYPPYR